MSMIRSDGRGGEDGGGGGRGEVQLRAQGQLMGAREILRQSRTDVWNC